MPTPVTSGSFSQQIAAIDLIEEAFKLCGIVAEGQPLLDEQVTDGMRALQLLAKRLGKDQIHLWAQIRATVFLDKGVASYELGPNGGNACSSDNFRYTTLSANAAAGDTVLNVESSSGFLASDKIGILLSDSTRFWTTISSIGSATTITIASALTQAATSGNSVFVYTNKIQRPLYISSVRRSIFNSGTPSQLQNEIDCEIWSQAQYDSQVNKLSQGTPVAAYYSQVQGQGAYTPALGSGILYTWQTPSTADYYFNITFTRPLQDITNSAQAIDFPNEWEMALVWNIARYLCTSYSVPDSKREDIKAEAAGLYQEILDRDEEMPASITIRPNFRGRA